MFTVTMWELPVMPGATPETWEFAERAVAEKFAAAVQWEGEHLLVTVE